MSGVQGRALTSLMRCPVACLSRPDPDVRLCGCPAPLARRVLQGGARSLYGHVCRKGILCCCRPQAVVRLVNLRPHRRHILQHFGACVWVALDLRWRWRRVGCRVSLEGHVAIEVSTLVRARPAYSAQDGTSRINAVCSPVQGNTASCVVRREYSVGTVAMLL